jgi:CBS domain-containing protein/uncharacterized protein (DUF2267 family)
MYEFIEYRVEDAMTFPPVTIGPEATLAEAERMFEEREFNMLPVVDDQRMIGVLSNLDLLRVFAFASTTMIPPYAELMGRRVREAMNPAPVTVDPDLPLTRALQKMVETRCKSLPVVRGDRVVGVVSREDVLRALRCAAASQGRESLRAKGPARRVNRAKDFLSDVARLVPCDEARAESLAFAVFQELRDRLTPAEAGDVAAQLPKGLKRLWTEQERAGREVRRTHQAEFVGRVRRRANLESEDGAERVVRSVFHALQRLLGSPRGLEGEAWDVFSQLPKDLKKLWLESSEHARS